MGRATEAMYYGKHGFQSDDKDKYSRLNITDKEVRKKMSEDRRKK